MQQTPWGAWRSAYSLSRNVAWQGQLPYEIWRNALRTERLKLVRLLCAARTSSPPRVEEAMGQTLHLGAPTVIESAAERSPYAALFEDDGKVAYFYGLDTRLGDQVLDAVHVYLSLIHISEPTRQAE